MYKLKINKPNLTQSVPLVVMKPSSKSKIVLDDTQKRADRAVPTGMNLAISGKGGTGKTFVITNHLMKSIEDYPLIYTREASYYRARDIDPDHTYLSKGVPGVLFISYTNAAVNVLRRSIDTDSLVMAYLDPDSGQHTVRRIQPKDLALTVNRLLQFRPADAETAHNTGISKGAFYPYRDAVNKLPPEITTIVLDEVGLLKIELTLQLIAAVDLNKIQFIFIGDICQTGASYGPSTLIRALTKLPRISFDKTYRFSGVLLEFADEVNDGKVKDITGNQILRLSENSSGSNDIVNVNFFTKKEDACLDKAMDRIKMALFKLITKGTMCLYTDLFIVPQKTQELGGNAIMGALFSLLDVMYGRPTFYLNTNDKPIILAVGDSILFDNRIGMVLAIGKNDSYLGNAPQKSMYVKTRDVETWSILYDQEYLGTVDSIVTTDNNNKTLDDLITKPDVTNEITTDSDNTKVDHSSIMLDLQEQMGTGEAWHINKEEEDEQEENNRKTRQLTNTLIVLDVTNIANDFTNHDPESADQIYKSFFKEVLDQVLFLHTSKQTTNDNSIDKDTTLNDIHSLVERLTVKYSIKTFSVLNMSQTSHLSSTGVKYNWRTVQQTQGSQSYSTMSIFCRKAHMATLLFRENLYTAYSRAISKEYSLVSRALLDGSLQSGGINGQRYPGLNVKTKLSNYLNKVRTVSMDELKLDKILEQMLLINKTRLAYYTKTGKSLLLDRSNPALIERLTSLDVVDSRRIGGDNEKPL